MHVPLLYRLFEGRALLSDVSLNLWHSGDLNLWPEWEMAKSNLTFSNVSSVCPQPTYLINIVQKVVFYLTETEVNKPKLHSIHVLFSKSMLV